MKHPLLCTALWLAVVSTASARDIYVDNVNGNDRSTGISPLATDPGGPVKSIHRAVLLAADGDVIVIRNNGIPYYEPIVLT